MEPTTTHVQQLELGYPTDSDSHSSNNNSDCSVVSNHCHGDTSKSKIDLKARKQLIIASAFCLVFMIGEIVGGVLAHSLALMSDGAHLLTDFASFMIAIMALYLGKKQSTKKMSFGFYRIEILGALVSILLLWLLTGILCYSAGLRIISGKYEIDATIMLITAGCGVFFNIVLGFTLHQSGHGHSHGGMSHGHSHGDSSHGHSHKKSSKTNSYSRFTEHEDSPHSHEPRTRYGSITDPGLLSEQMHDKKADNINVKAAFVHVIGDLLQSIGVLIAALIIYFKPEWKMADPICTFMFSVFVLFTTVTILRDIIVILMEGTPRSIDFSDVMDTFYSIKGIRDIHDLRIWSLTMDKLALSVHIAIDDDADPNQVIKVASFVIQKKFGIKETTMQTETHTEDMITCSQCRHLKD